MSASRIAHYEILSPLGKGGMGEVFRARDTKLDRHVAIKVLPAELQRDPERVARFSREARTLASLHHPNIASLFGIEEDGDRRFLVMELVEGEDLSQVLRRGPLGLDDALDVARQLAEGLEEAHEKGIVHRDLKPANVMRTPEGQVKILDFGLARAVMGEGVDEADPSNSPTITAAMTLAGTVLGTAAYMSPEQARGRPVDRRADLWAFGVVLWEMLTGQGLFEGETVSDTLAAVLRAPVDMDALPAETPVAVRRLLERCLERDPRKRLRDIGEARVRLERWRDDPSTLHASASIPVAVERERTRPWPWVVAAIALAVAGASWFLRPNVAPAPPLELGVSIVIDDLDPVTPNIGPSIVLSPDGRHLAYFANATLRLMDLRDGTTRDVHPQSFASCMTFSPDSRWVAYQAAGSIWRARVDGGAPIEVCEVGDPRGITWPNDETLVITRDFVGGLFSVSLRDGSLRALTVPDSAAGERSHRWPDSMPDGRHVLFTAQFQRRDYEDSDLRVVDVETREVRTLHRGGSFVRDAGDDLLTFVQDRKLVAMRFDPVALEVSGLPVPVLEDLATLVVSQELDDGSAEITWSDEGLMLYRTDYTTPRFARPAWTDLATGESGATDISAPGNYVQPILSPDGESLAIARDVAGVFRVVMIDLESGVSRVYPTSPDMSFPNGFSPDGAYIYWSEWGGGQFGVSTYRILRGLVDAPAAPETLAVHSTGITLSAVHPDGVTGLLLDYGSAGNWNVYEMSLVDRDRPWRPISVGTQVSIGQGYSPDGRWIVLERATSSSDIEIVIVSRADPSLKWVVYRCEFDPPQSIWRPDGSGILVRNRGKRELVDVPIDFSGGIPRPGQPRTLRSDDYAYARERTTMALTGDGGRLIVLVPEVGGIDGARIGRTLLTTGAFERMRAQMADFD